MSRTIYPRRVNITTSAADRRGDGPRGGSGNTCSGDRAAMRARDKGGDTKRPKCPAEGCPRSHGGARPQTRPSKRRWDARRWRITPVADHCFDAAYLITVLGETPYPQAAQRDLNRVLKPSGRR